MSNAILVSVTVLIEITNSVPVTIFVDVGVISLFDSVLGIATVLIVGEDEVCSLPDAVGADNISLLNVVLATETVQIEVRDFVSATDIVGSILDITDVADDSMVPDNAAVLLGITGVADNTSLLDDTLLYVTTDVKVESLIVSVLAALVNVTDLMSVTTIFVVVADIRFLLVTMDDSSMLGIALVIVTALLMDVMDSVSLTTLVNAATLVAVTDGTVVRSLTDVALVLTTTVLLEVTDSESISILLDVPDNVSLLDVLLVVVIAVIGVTEKVPVLVVILNDVTDVSSSLSDVLVGVNNDAGVSSLPVIVIVSAEVTDLVPISTLVDITDVGSSTNIALVDVSSLLGVAPVFVVTKVTKRALVLVTILINTTALTDSIILVDVVDNNALEDGADVSLFIDTMLE